MTEMKIRQNSGEDGLNQSERGEIRVNPDCVAETTTVETKMTRYSQDGCQLTNQIRVTVTEQLND